MTMANDQKQEWNDSYTKQQNFVFSPHEEVVRFVSRYIRKRVGLHAFQDVCIDAGAVKLLDLGCGIGLHVIYAHQMGLQAYGVDLSNQAITVACDWASECGIPEPGQRIKVGDVRALPWSDSFFDAAVSHGVLDSMHLEIAQDAVREMHRVLRPTGLFYCDVISGDDAQHAREFAGEEIVATAHEQGTIQSYFNFSKIAALFGVHFDMLECKLVRHENVLTGAYASRYHLILKRR